MPIGLRDRLDVSVGNWAAQCFAVDKSGLGGEVCALSEMAEHMSLPKDFFAPSDVLGPGMVGLRNCGSPSAHLETQKAIAEGYRVPHFLSTQQASGRGELNDAYTLPGVGNTVGGATEVRSHVVPLLRLLGSRRRNPGAARPPGGGRPRGRAMAVCNFVIRTLARAFRLRRRGGIETYSETVSPIAEI